MSHTHWDREWYFSFQQFRRRFVKLVDGLFSLFDDDERFNSFMMDGKFLIIKDYLEIKPEMTQKIKALVEDGKITIGPWFSQPNEFLVSGESLIRNLILGRRECEKFGGSMNICYLPDAFGQISQFPQIANGFSLRDIVTWRGIPSGSMTVVKWKGPDDSETNVYNMIGSYGNAVALPPSSERFEETIDSTSIPREGLAERVEYMLGVLSPRSTTKNILFMNGADHAFPQSDLHDVLGRINEEMPGIEAIHSTLPDYVNAVRREHEEKEIAYQIVEGELRDSTEARLLPGSQSTSTDIKIINSRIERMFEKWVEPFAAFSWMLGFDYPQSLIWKAWEYLLENHEHDSLACSSVNSVNRQVRTRFEWAEELGKEIVSESLQRICRLVTNEGVSEEKEQNLVIFNALNWTRSEVITIDLDVPDALKIERPMLMDRESRVPMIIHGETHQSYLKYNPREGISDFIPTTRFRATLSLHDIPGIGYRALRLTDSITPAARVEGLVKSDTTLENEYFILDFNANGTFDITVKSSGMIYESLHYFEDNGEAGDGFRHDAPVNDQTILSLGAITGTAVVENNHLKATIELRMNMNLPKCISSDRKTRSTERVPCSIISYITVMRGVPRVDIQTRIVNNAMDHRLRVIFPAGIKSEHSYAEQPFDVVERPIAAPEFNKYPKDDGRGKGYEEVPVPTHPQLSFVDITDGKEGMMIANRGLYEYEIKNNDRREMAITLLRCTDRLFDPHFSESDVGIISDAQCLGENIFEYSIIPHSGNWEEGWKSANEFAVPMKALVSASLEEETLPNYSDLEHMKELPIEHSFLRTESDDIRISAIKKCESRESIIVRLFNPTDKRIKSQLIPNFPRRKFKKAYQTNLDEERENELTIESGGSINITLDKKKIVTIELD